MKKKFSQSIPAILAIAAISFRYFSQDCILASAACYGTWIHEIYLRVTNPVFYFAIFFLPIAFVLVFISRSIFNSWLRFAAWAIPLAVLFVFLVPDSNPGVYLDFFPFYRDDAARLAGGVFAALSLVLIIWRWFAARHAARPV